MPEEKRPIVSYQPRKDDANEPQRIERTQPLHPGKYWRAKKRVKDNAGQEIPAGMVLLLTRIKRVDDTPHSVELHPHPLSDASTHRFLLDAFLRAFNPEERGVEIRDAEILAVQDQITAQQRELVEFQTDPSKTFDLLRKHPALPRPGKHASHHEREDAAQLPAAPVDFEAGLPDGRVTSGTTLITLAQAGDPELLMRQISNQAIVAKTRATHIAKLTEEIGETVGKLTPFYEERGAAALAQTEDALDLYHKIKNGLMTLGLYTGTDVKVTEVARGAPAAETEPLHIMQQRLHMDEESLINLYEGGADCKDFQEFVKLLSTDALLLERIAPFPRTLVAMQYTREAKEYADPHVDAIMNENNRRAFLVLRNGAAIYTIHCPIERMSRLFPTASDMQQPFTRPGWFHGVESEEITLDDIEYADAKESYDNLVLHYRRIVILLAGLVDREPHVVGGFPALARTGGLGLLNLALQGQCFRFVSDEENVLASGMPTFRQWIGEKNKSLQSGSRVLVYWDEVMTPTTAPAAVAWRARSNGYDSKAFRYEPKTKSAVVIASRNGEHIEVKALVSGRVYPREQHRDAYDREFKATVNLSLYSRDRGGQFGFLCLDAVSLGEVEHYIRARHDRFHYFDYVPLLYEARRHLLEDARHEKPLRSQLVSALAEGDVLLDPRAAAEAVNQVIRQWRAAHRGAPVPLPAEGTYKAEFASLLDQLWVLAGRGRDRKAAVEEMMVGEGRAPLRLTISGRGRLVLYAAPLQHELEELLGTHVWVKRIALEERKTKISQVDSRWVLLKDADPAETTLVEWPGAKDWVLDTPPYRFGYQEVQGLRNLGQRAIELVDKYLTPKSDAEFKIRLDNIKADTLARTKKIIEHGWVFLPFALVQLANKKKARGEPRHRVLGLHMRGVDALYWSGTPAQRKLIEAWFSGYYRKPEKNIPDLASVEHKRPVGYFASIALSTFMGRAELGEDDASPASGRRSDPRPLKTMADELAAYAWGKEREDRDTNVRVLLRFDEAAARIEEFSLNPAKNRPTRRACP